MRPKANQNRLFEAPSADKPTAGQNYKQLPQHLQELVDLLPLNQAVHRSVLEEKYGRSNYARRIRKIVSEYGWVIERERRSSGANDDWYTRRSEGPVRLQRIRKEVNPATRRTIYQRDEWQCQMCGRDVSETQTVVQPQCDHKIPSDRGGETIPENLQTLCTICNLKKRQACQHCRLATCDNCPYAAPEQFVTSIQLILSTEAARKLEELVRITGEPPLVLIERLIRDS